MDLSILAALAFAMTTTAPAPIPVQFEAEAARVVLYPPSGELRLLSALDLPADAQAAFDNEFTPSTYFSAFATSKSGGWGYATSTNSLEAAHAIAMGECLDANDACRVVAEILPRGYRPPQPGDITLTPEVAALFLDPESAGAPLESLRALAVSADGAYAMSWGHPTQGEADEAALADCRTHLTRPLPGVPAMPCVLVPGLPGTR